MPASPLAFYGQSISVFDNSGKVVRNSKHLLDVFREARAAYRARKSEVLSPDLTPRSPPPAYRSHPTSPSRAPSYHRRRSTDHSSAASTPSIYPASHARHTHALPLRPSATRTVTSPPPRQSMQLARRHTSHDLVRAGSPPYDPDLAYGPIPPALLSSPANAPAVATRINTLLLEADCLRASAAATIAHLHRHPDAMAAVAVSLAELSGLLTRAGPGVLTAVRSAAPGVWALLASPQVAMALGLGVGVTVVVIGGWRVVSRLRKRRAAAQMSLAGEAYAQPRELEWEEEEEDEREAKRLEVGGMQGIERWRRGVAPGAESVEGEFATPGAMALGGWVPDSSRSQRHGSVDAGKTYDGGRPHESRRRRASDVGLARRDDRPPRHELPRSATFADKLWDQGSDRESRHASAQGSVRRERRRSSLRGEKEERSERRDWDRESSTRDRRDADRVSHSDSRDYGRASNRGSRDERDRGTGKSKGKEREKTKPKPSPLRSMFS